MFSNVLVLLIGLVFFGSILSAEKCEQGCVRSVSYWLEKETLGEIEWNTNAQGN